MELIDYWGRDYMDKRQIRTIIISVFISFKFLIDANKVTDEKSLKKNQKNSKKDWPILSESHREIIHRKGIAIVAHNIYLKKNNVESDRYMVITHMTLVRPS